jgi:hypothetical protein
LAFFTSLPSTPDFSIMILTTTLKNALLNLTFGQTAWAGKPASNLHFGLFTAAPTDDGGGTEVSAAGYTRAALAVGAGFTAMTALGGTVPTAAAVTFPQSNASWGAVVAWGIFDASASGNLLMWSTMSPQAIGVNFTPSWPAGSFVFSTSGSVGDWLTRSLLNYLLVGTAFPTVGKHYFALGTGATSAGIVSEPAIGTNAYARKAMDNLTGTYGAASSGSKVNAAAITFPASTTAPWGSMSHFAIYTAGGAAATVTASSSGGLLLTTGAAHNLAVGDIFQLTNSGGALPANTAVLTNYYVQAVPSATTFRLALTAGGAAVAYGDAGTGTHTVSPMVIWHGALDAVVGSTLGDAPSFAASALTLAMN